MMNTNITKYIKSSNFGSLYSPTGADWVFLFDEQAHYKRQPVSRKRKRPQVFDKPEEIEIVIVDKEQVLRVAERRHDAR